MSKQFNHLNIPSHWQSYWTRFPEGHTILEALIQWVSQVDEMVDNQNKLSDTVSNYGTRLDQFIDQFEGNLSEKVIDTLGEWQQSGFLDIVIDQALDTKYHEMDDRLTSQLAQITHQVNSNGIDDTDNINQGIDYVDSLGGGTLLLPDNEYIYTSDIHVKEGVILEGQQRTHLKCNATRDARIIFYNSVQMRNITFDIPEGYNDSMFLFSNEFLVKQGRRDRENYDGENSNVKVFIENIKAYTSYTPYTPNKKAVELYATFSNDVGATTAGYWGIKMEDVYLDGFNTMFHIETEKTGWVNGNLFKDVSVNNFEHAVKVNRSSESLGIDYNVFELIIQTGSMTKDIIVDDNNSTNNYNSSQFWDMETHTNARVGTGLVKNVMNGISVPKEKYTNYLVSRSYYLLGRFSKFTSTTHNLMINLVSQNNFDTDYFIRGDDELVERRVHGLDIYNERIKFFKKELPNGQVELYLYNDHDVETYTTVYIEAFRDFYPSPFVRYNNVDGLVELTNVEDFYPSPKGMYTKGSNENGSWVKYDDGTMICRTEVASDLTPSNPFGALFSSDSAEWVFPQEFLTTTALNISVSYSLGNRWGDISATPTTKSCRYNAISVLASSTPATVYLMATGRWK